MPLSNTTNAKILLEGRLDLSERPCGMLNFTRPGRGESLVNSITGFRGYYYRMVSYCADYWALSTSRHSNGEPIRSR